VFLKRLLFAEFAAAEHVPTVMEGDVKSPEYALNRSETF
jgi:hypothetical protein